MISIGGSIVAISPVAVINICVTFTIEDIILFCVKRYYVPGEYKFFSDIHRSIPILKENNRTNGGKLKLAFAS